MSTGAESWGSKLQAALRTGVREQHSPPLTSFSRSLGQNSDPHGRQRAPQEGGSGAQVV